MSKPSRRSLVLGALFGLMLIANACSKKAPEPEAAAPGPSRGLKPPPEPPPARETPPPPPPTPFQFPDDPKPANEPQAAAEEQPEPANAPPARDYAAELKTLVGSPSGCLKPRVGAESPREISVAVEAVVMETGMVSRAYVRSGELDDDELACIRARLGSARMASGVELAPRTVTTSVSLVLQPSATRVPAAAPGTDQTGQGEPGSQPQPSEQQAPAPAQPAPEAPPSGYGQPEPSAGNPE